MGKIVFLGDSVTKGTDYGGVTAIDCYGYKAAIAAGYAASDIYNAGVSGNTAAMMLARLQTDVIALTPSVCVVMALINDAINAVGVETYKTNLRSIVSTLKCAGIKPVLASPPLYRGNPATHMTFREYLFALDAIVRETRVDYIDIYRQYAFDYLCNETDFYSRYVTNDTIHQTVAGHTAIASLIGNARYTGMLLPEPSPDVVPLVLATADYLLGGQTSAQLQSIQTERDKF